jgi:hypothetical protein
MPGVSVTDDSKAAAASFDRKSMVVLVPALLLMVAGLYVRITTDEDPLWADLTTPLFFALIGARSILRPTPPETRKANRYVGILLIIVSVVLAVLAITNSQGAN